ncbi:MAG: Ca-activated chloride channel family protein [Halieaceae bacterium]|jgi:Ca-activated chloride channel family protein
MLEFVYPWMFVLLILPLLVARFVPPYREQQDSIRVPFFRQLVTLSGEEPQRGAVELQRTRWQRALMPLAWLLVITAMAKPEWIAEPIVREKSARDVMVAVDLSGSMAATDFVNDSGQQVDRLTALKQVLVDFLAQRGRDRLGLILFGDSPYLQVPFTEDHDTWLTMLNESEIGMAGQSTVLGDAIGLAIKLFEASETENRVLVILTDGNDTGSRVPPVDAAKVAAAKGLKIYTVAIGDPATQGEEALDLEVLTRMSEITGGQYYVALNREELQAAWAAIAAHEPALFQTISYRPRLSVHHVPLFVLMGIYAVFHGVMILLGWRSRSADHG